jgi:hypothetical protein
MTINIYKYLYRIAMSITLDNSNISVQYSTGSNYIIETVKSDLYRRNEIYDNIVRDNIQVAPVTPSLYIENGTNNVYAVESYTYSGSANTADFTRVFTKSTTCDILIVGGGGAGGGSYVAGGGGAGGYVYIPNFSLNGSYSIKVGRGGNSRSLGIVGENGQDSTFGIYTAVGGGGGASNPYPNTTVPASSGGSGGGGTTLGASSPIRPGGSSTQIIYTSPIVSKGSAGRSSGTVPNRGGGGGGSGILEGDTANGTSGIVNDITGNNVFYAAGGGGGTDGTTRALGGSGIGGNGGIVTSGSTSGTSGTSGTGSGGGGSGGIGDSGAGGSGIVIIRYLLGTIPSNNLLTNANEPIITSPTFTETVRSFTHSGGTETQTTHTITIGQNTICDILIVGGGGGGGDPHGGGGGAGQLVFIHQATLNGTYTIKVGKGGIGGVFVSTAATKGSNSEFGNVIAEGGGANGGTNVENKNGGSGAGGDGYTTNGGTAGAGTKNNIVDTFQGAIVYSKGNDGGAERLSDARGGGGGGSGMSGDTGANGGKGGNGLSGISEISYDFKTNFGTNVGKLESDNLIYFAGGGGGGNSTTGVNNGSKGGGGSGGLGDVGPNNIGVNATENTGSGGGGGGANSSAYGGNGGSGIVIIKFKSITSAGILEGITHKRLNFNYINSNDNLIFYYRIDESPFSWLEAYNEAIINGRRLPTITELRTYMTNYPSIVAPFNGLDIWSAVVNPAVANSKDWVQVGNNPHTRGKSHTQDLGVYPSWGDNTTETFARVYWDVVDLNQLRYDFTPYNTEATWKSYAATIPNFTYSLDTFLITFDPDAVWTGYSVVGWVQMTLPSGYNFLTITYGLGVQGTEDVRLLINGVLKSSATTTNRLITYSQAYNVGDVVRIEETFSTMNANFIFQFTNIYPYQHTLNFPVPTIADINNNSNIVLRGAYDLSLSTSNAVIIPKAGQYIPKPTTFTNYSIERMYPPVRNFTAATTTLSGQTYGNGTYVVSYSSTYGSGYDPFKCFNTSDIAGGIWADNRYTAGNFNSTSFIVEGYLGDWLKIQLPVAIKLTRFEFLMRNEGSALYRSRSPKDFKIYGSNDGITWVELVTKIDAVYNASYIYEQTTPEITRAYSFYALVVNKLFSTGVLLNFDEWYIYGQEVLPSSLSLRYNLLNPILDPIGAQWTYSSNNTNVYHMGSVGIGTTSPEYHLDVRGNIFSSTGGFTQSGLTTWSITSDRRIKENIVKASYEKCLENIKNIELYNFNFKDNYVSTNDRHQLGFIAQEVQQVYPKAVEVGKMMKNNGGTEDILTLNTTQIKYTLYGAVKKLIEKVDNIESKINKLYDKVFITPIIETSNIYTNNS